ncbi:MAG TPA: hypothetical protein VJ810_05800 [Blastocatellia bacterium]|nr:hypothetical protein [Blastocatellia bacterium]
MANLRYKLIEIENSVPIEAWMKGVKPEDEAKKQHLKGIQLPFVYRCYYTMPEYCSGY